MPGCRFCGRPAADRHCSVCGAGLCSEEHFRLSCSILHPAAHTVGGAPTETAR